MPAPNPLTLALDWTPNTNHTGFYVAQARGWFAEAGVDVRIVHPGQDDYASTPARKVAEGEAELALAPSESVLSYRMAAEPVPLVAVAAVLATDASALVTLESSGLSRPADLDGRTYASYQARFEDAIVRDVVRADGGQGDVRIVYPPKLGIWDTLLDGTADATWIFDPWEGVQADRAGVALHRFAVGDYGVPYGYSPVVLGRADVLRSRRGEVEAFLSAARRGFVFAAEHLDAAAQLLSEAAAHPTLSDLDFVRASQRAIAPHYASTDRPWGEMDPAVWTRFVGWIAERGLLTSRSGERLPTPDASDLFTNDLLPAASS
jgi:NitT/TauT family transport system substrate-binding protein